MPAAELPRIDPRLCTSSGDCVALCPTACLSWQGFVPVVEPTRCIGCALCRDVCPAQAITMMPR